MMRFPMLCRWLDIRKDGETYRIRNTLTEEEFVCTEYGDEDFIAFIRWLDGKTDPYRIPCRYSREMIAGILQQLKECGLIRTSRWLNRSVANPAYSLFIPKRKSVNPLPFRILSGLMILLLCPSLLTAFVDLPRVLEAVRSVSIPGLLCGSVLGTALHEAGHAVAALACGGQVFEFGIALNDLVVPGAYALIERKEHTSLWQDLQIDAAGIETNVLLGGLFFHLALRIPAWVDFFTMAGIINLTMMLLNLAGIMGCDGAHILGRLLGIRGEAGEKAGDVLLHRDQREYWLEKGIAGKATLAAYVLILLMQAAIPAMMIVELLGVMACFV